jgi:uncharacterized protein (DUF305 family)
MNKNIWIAGIIGLILGIIVTVLYVPMWGKRIGYQKNNMPMIGGNQMMGNIDAHFIKQMIPHHESAIDMADIALQKAEHQEIKQLAQNINTSQSAEIDKMKQWYKNWFGEEISLISTASAHGHEGGMGMMGMMGDDTDLDRLKNAQPFDKAFIEEMIPHHQMAVMMAQMLERTTTRPEMKHLAHDIIDAQTKEIEDMRGWYKAWYNK